eukprot:CAMPEP_0119322304 /NCGR_PEP_ID=MMETSP1333-20130426/57784_1 /TAXON_ID=418940 /ORGANISM="Scyphosphaera apsteinii, Strain RCC1455" /LENGTH=88 /DNA_ID=CAMNT_0007329495 /DNA_START=367 /DNA_END=633 /DNA_ORIENTATION=+
MWPTSLLVEALGKNSLPISIDDHAAHPRIWRGAEAATFGELDCIQHPALVLCWHCCQEWQWPSRDDRSTITFPASRWVWYHTWQQGTH